MDFPIENESGTRRRTGSRQARPSPRSSSFPRKYGVAKSSTWATRVETGGRSPRSFPLLMLRPYQTTFDVTNPAQPLLMGAYTNTTAKTLDVVGTAVYVCDGLLRILSASSPASLTEIGGIDLGNFPDQIRVAGGFAFVAFGREGFKVVAVSNPSSPVVRATVKGVGRVNGVAITGNVALTGNDGGGMDTVDVSNPARPVALGHIGTEPVSNIAVLGNTAVLVNYGDEVVSIVDVAQPAMPVLRSTYTALKWVGSLILGSEPCACGFNS